MPLYNIFDYLVRHDKKLDRHAQIRTEVSRCGDFIEYVRTGHRDLQHLAIHVLARQTRYETKLYGLPPELEEELDLERQSQTLFKLYRRLHEPNSKPEGTLLGSPSGDDVKKKTRKRRGKRLKKSLIDNRTS